MAFYNLARMYTFTTGDSDVTLGTAVPGCKTFAAAGVSDSEEVNYGIITYDLTTHRPTGSEAGTGKYISSGTVFKRTTVANSTDTDDSAISLTGLSEIYLCPLASDYNGFGAGGSAFAVYESSSADTISNAGTVDPLNLNTEVVDASGLFTLSSDELTCAQAGWYEFTIQLDASDADNFGNGVFTAWLTSSSTTPSYFPYLVVQTAADPAKTELNFTFGGAVALDIGDTVSFGADNNTGGSIDVQLMQVLIKRLGDI